MPDLIGGARYVKYTYTVLYMEQEDDGSGQVEDLDQNENFEEMQEICSGRIASPSDLRCGPLCLASHALTVYSF